MTTSTLSASGVLTLGMLQVGETIGYLYLHVWLISLSMMTFKFTYFIVTSNRIFFFNDWTIIHSMYMCMRMYIYTKHITFSFQFISRYLGFSTFQLLLIMLHWTWRYKLDYHVCWWYMLNCSHMSHLMYCSINLLVFCWKLLHVLMFSSMIVAYCFLV